MLKSYLEVIKNKDFRYLWLGQIISQIALNMLSFVLAIRVYQETQSNAAVSFMLLAFAIPSIIFGVIAGGIVDFLDKRKVMLYCNLSRVFLILAFFFYARNLVIVYALSVIISIISQFFIPAEGPAIPSLVPEKQLLTANSLFTISFYLSMILGFILAGPFVRILGPKTVFLFMGLLMLLAAYYIYRIPKKKLSVRRLANFNFSFIGRAIDDGITFIHSNKRIEQSLLLMTFSQALLSILAVLAPGFADRMLAIDLTDASYLVMGPAAIGLVCGAFAVGAYGNKFIKTTIITVGIIGVGVNLLLLSIISGPFSLITAMVLLFTLGIFNSFISVPANTILQQDSDSNMRGRVYGVLTSLTGGVSLIPVVFSGILADQLGVGLTMALLGLAIAAVGIYHYLRHQFLISSIK